MIGLMPDSDAQRWRTFIDEVYMKNQREGSAGCQTEFMASLINVPDSPYPPDLNDRISGNMDFFFKHEFRAFLGIYPILRASEKIMCKW